MLRARILGVSVWGPGLEGWAAGRAALAGGAWEARASPPPPPAILPANERRRTGPVVRLALAVAQEAAAMSGLDPAALPGVFASSSGDGVVVGSILEGLTAAGAQGALNTQGAPQRVVSPTQFHNSVHNAAAGYWSIAHSSRAPMNCLGGHDASLAAGLLSALVELAEGGVPVLLCAYDHPLPAPMDVKRPVALPFALGLVLGPAEGPGFAGIAAAYRAGAAGWPAARAPGLQALAEGNPIGAGLRLLETLARGDADRYALPYLDAHLALEVACG